MKANFQAINQTFSHRQIRWSIPSKRLKLIFLILLQLLLEPYDLNNSLAGWLLALSITNNIQFLQMRIQRTEIGSNSGLHDTSRWAHIFNKHNIWNQKKKKKLISFHKYFSLSICTCSYSINFSTLKMIRCCYVNYCLIQLMNINFKIAGSLNATQLA